MFSLLQIIGLILGAGIVLFLLVLVNETYWWIFHAPGVEEIVIATLARVDKMKAISLRKSLEEQGCKLGISRFYIFMAHLVEEGQVELWHEPHTEYEGLREYWYKFIGGGRKKKVRSPIKLGLQSLLPHPVM